MQLLLAPMEGLLDYALRDTLTRVGQASWPSVPVVQPDLSVPGDEVGSGAEPPGALDESDGADAVRAAPHPSGIDRCVSEFIRITDTLLPARAFIRTMPELRTGGRTLTGVPVRGQLLGSDPTLLAENAARLAELGSHGVDLNFGCPAKVVNRHGGGSALLDDPELVHRIVAAVRRAVPAQVPVSAKMRLGFNDDHRAEDNALAIEAAGATEIVVHARTKAHGYRPPAYWERIADLKREVKLPMVANGEIWTVEDALRAQAASGCTSLMLGRGMVADPGLASAIRLAVARGGAVGPGLYRGTTAGAEIFDQNLPAALSNNEFAAMVNESRPEAACGFNGPVVTGMPVQVSWAELLGLMWAFWQRVEQRVERRHRAGRLKQWLNLLRRRYPQAQAAFDALRTTQDPDVLRAWLQTGVRAGNAQADGSPV
ncbi:MAG TPA: tRNA-dihydrouridine synthase family protein [Burkholderiaceae bacterium]|nr:tRNA-dihydrouridine synthase family protein [Burkholderiaceae bacterium]